MIVGIEPLSNVVLDISKGNKAILFSKPTLPSESRLSNCITKSCSICWHLTTHQVYVSSMIQSAKVLWSYKAWKK